VGRLVREERRWEGRKTETFAPISPPRASSVTIKSLSFSMNASKYLQENKWSSQLHDYTCRFRMRSDVLPMPECSLPPRRAALAKR